MNATLGRIVSYACYAAIAVEVAYVIFVYALPFVWKTLVEQCHCLRRTGGICFSICAVFVCGAILYGGTKRGPATPRPPLQQIVPPPSEPAPLQVVENWKKRGAWEDGVLVRFPDGWCFPFASNHLTHVELWSQGAVYPSSSSIDPIASLGALVSLVPGESEVRHGMSPENAYVFEWQSAHVGRSEDDIMDGAIALHRNGDVVVTTNGIVSHIAYEVPFAHDGWGQDDEWVAANFENGLTAEWYRGWVDGNVGTDLPNGFY